MIICDVSFRNTRGLVSKCDQEKDHIGGHSRIVQYLERMTEAGVIPEEPCLSVLRKAATVLRMMGADLSRAEWADFYAKDIEEFIKKAEDGHDR